MFTRDEIQKKTDIEKEHKIKFEALEDKVENILEKLSVFTFQKFEKDFYSNIEASNTITYGFDSHISHQDQRRY